LDARHSNASTRRLNGSRLDSQVLREAISTALNAAPTDERALRLRVWEYVGIERDAGTTAGHVIVALTDLVEGATVIAPDLRQTLLRSVILWYVEAYFGHIGGDVVGREGNAFSDRPLSAARR
jgi:hypothetical protein